MSTLGLLVTTDDELVAQVDGRECDTVVGMSELYRGDVKEHVNATWGRILVVADSVTLLRALLPQLSSMASRSKVFDVVVSGIPRQGLLDIPPAPVGLRTLASAQRRTVRQLVPHIRLSLEFKGNLGIGDTLAAMLNGVTSVFQRPVGGMRVGIADDAPEMMSWACGDPSARRLTDAVATAASDAPSAVDIMLSGHRPDGPRRSTVPELELGGERSRPLWIDLLKAPHVGIEQFVARTRAHHLVPPVDTDTLTPIGFLGDTNHGETSLRRAERRDGGHRLLFDDRAGRVSPSFDDWSGVSERVAEYVRGYRVVYDNPFAHDGPVQHASFLVQAACAALPIATHGLSDTVRRMIGPGLAGRFEALNVGDLTERIQREAYCMSIRREAFRRHGARRRWRAMADDTGMWTPPAPTVSVIMATCRPELLPRIAEQVGQQDWSNAELVLGLHGFSRDDPRARDFEATWPGALVLAELPAERVFGDVLNDLCAMASGDLLTKMDDDDWYSAHHITDLVHAAEFSNADLVGSGAEFMYLEALDVTVRRHRTSGNRFANRVPGAALLISAQTLRAVGGWRPIRRGVDTALARAILDSGGSVYRTHGLSMVVYRAADGHTWDPSTEYFVRGDVDQWPGFAPPPDIIGAGPQRRTVPMSWFDR